MTLLNFPEIMEEQLVFLRNKDIMTTTQRSVTTTNDTGVFASTSSYTISKTNVRNIRSISVASVSKSLGTDYTVSYTTTPGASQNCVISFVAAQTGSYTISYDYGTDRIFNDYPRGDLTLASFPRVSVELLSGDSTEASLGGGSVVTNLSVTITVLAASTNEVNTIINTARQAYLNNKKSFYYVKFCTPISISPLIKSPNHHDKIVQRTIDVLAPLNFEE